MKNAKKQQAAGQPPTPDKQLFKAFHTPVWEMSFFTEYDHYLFRAGKHFRLYEKFGSHVCSLEGVEGTYFAVWAPQAIQVAVMGDFNGWSKTSHSLRQFSPSTGIWEGFIPHVGHGGLYKYAITGMEGQQLEKGDPYALRWEQPPKKASVIWKMDYSWKDRSWMSKRTRWNAVTQPVSVYELHLGSWQRDPANPERVLSYREIATPLVAYVLEMGFTHVEIMPIMEYPYEPSWGYQITGYFAASSRHGLPEELMELISQLHLHGIGVFLDWVPSHFPGDEQGLHYFDGTFLYEHADMKKGFHPDWKSYIFNYDRPEVRSFLISNALFWLEKYHVDGLRVDAVASMLYFDFSRKPEESGTNAFGGRENLGAISFLQDLNEAVKATYPGVVTIAEESTTFEGVTKDVVHGGLGFDMKWMMGWMNDTIRYFKREPVHRKFHHYDLTFSITYAFSERFMLPFSHDEVVHGKASMIYKMPGDEWQKFANLRSLYAYMYTHPGTKLLFMGNEFAQTNEWNFNESLSWHLLSYAPHAGMKEMVRALNFLYREERALHHYQFDWQGFEWINADDQEHSVFVYLRKSNRKKDTLLIVINLTPVFMEHFRIGLPEKGRWTELLNTDDQRFYGSGKLHTSPLTAEKIPYHGQKQSAVLQLAPLAAMIFKRQDSALPRTSSPDKPTRQSKKRQK